MYCNNRVKYAVWYEHFLIICRFIKAVPLHVMEALGAEEVFYSFLTSTLDGGEWSASRPAAFTPVGYEAGWASELVWTQRLQENPLPLPGFEIRSSSL
jgi:hypothetical protein